MKVGRIVLATVVITVLEIIISMLTCGWLFNWVYELEPINVWKAQNEVPFIAYNIILLVLNFIFVFFYALFNKGIPSQNKFTKGLLFGLSVWFLGMLPGMLATYSFMVVATTVIIYWTISSLIIIPLKGLITSGIYGE